MSEANAAEVSEPAFVLGVSAWGAAVWGGLETEHEPQASSGVAPVSATVAVDADDNAQE